MRILSLFLLTILFLIISVSIVNAAVMEFLTIEPPKQYRDVEPTIPYEVYRLSMKDLQWTCKNQYFPIGVIYGCSKTLKGPDRCAVFIPKSTVYNIGFPFPPIPFLTPERILRHEKAHCAGWPRTHPR